jgi:hypothetical protein
MALEFAERRYVALDSRPMRTNFGTKMRPQFTVIEWREINPPQIGAGGGQPQIGGGIAGQIEHKKVAEQQSPASVSQKEKPVGPKKTATKVGKPVKSISSSEALDDEIPL